MMISGSIPKTKAAPLLPRTNKPRRVSLPGCVQGQREKPRRGFTLIELLLAVALVLLLVSAAIFSFSTLLRGTQLEEGAGQVESLMRFARAQAANTGRRVQIVFDEDEDSDSSAGIIRVVWEPDPLGEPGIFVQMAEAIWQAESINGLIRVESVESSGSAGMNPLGAAPAVLGQPTEGAMTKLLSPITFYPDGASDSAEIVLSSLEPDETHQMAVRIDGLTGAIRHRIVSDVSDDELEPTNAPRAASGNNMEKQK